MARDFDLNDYIPVAEREEKFYEKYPDGRIQACKPEVVVIGEGILPKPAIFIWCQATAWRSVDDPLPAIASAWEEFPGPTPFTKNSEAMNAETSAIGRVLAMVGIEVKRGMASREDVSRQRESSTSGNWRNEVLRAAAQASLSIGEVCRLASDGKKKSLTEFEEDERQALDEAINRLTLEKAG